MAGAGGRTAWPKQTRRTHSYTIFPHKPRGTYTATCDRLAVSSIGTTAGQHASFSVVSRRAGLITVKPCPSRRAGAFTRKRMAAHSVGSITGTDLVTDVAVQTRGTESLLAIRAFKPSFT